jgi:phosphatidylglycerophosphatase A
MKKNNISSWEIFLGSFFYLGKLKGGGTYTSIISAIIFYYFFDWNSFIYILLVTGITIFGLALSYGHKSDYQWFTIDELAGMSVTFIFHTKSISVLIIGLIVFRLFDIFKLPFIKKLEKKRFGIVIDDIIAGLIANGFLWIVRYLWTVR